MRRTLIALALSAAGLAQAATVSVFTDLVTWTAALSGSAQLQDFSSYAVGTDLTGVAVLPGVTLTSNLGPVEVFNATTHNVTAFGPARQAGNAYYQGNYALPFLAAALDITSFESIPGNNSTAAGPGLLTFTFSDSSTQDIAVLGNATGSPVFVGIIADAAITSFKWAEALEGNGGNEETGLDNLRIAMRAPGNPLPLPGSLPLAVLALAAVPLARRRR
jgi:hypothetical protein